MIPIRDDNPTTHATPATAILIVLNVLVFLLQAALSGPAQERFVWKYGFIPAKLLHAPDEFEEQLPENAPTAPAVTRSGRLVLVRQEVPVAAAVAMPAWLTLVTCMFLHGGWMHLIGNMLYLWIFGNNIEDRLGPLVFVLYYLLTGVVGSLAHTYFEASWAPLVGASGAVSGLMGGYLLLHPHARLLAVVPLGWYWFTVKLPAWIFLGIYVVIQNLFPVYFTAGSPVAYWAHIGGFGAGLALILFLPARPPAAVPVRARRVVDDDDADFVL